MEKKRLSKQTTHNHLKHLVRDGILTRETIINGKGRPKIFYNRSEKPIKISKEEVVSVSFRKLKSLCKKKTSYGYCEEKNKECCSLYSPAVLK
jgi:predicted ArsR family transcriptional regulator